MTEFPPVAGNPLDLLRRAGRELGRAPVTRFWLGRLAARDWLAAAIRTVETPLVTFPSGSGGFGG